MNSQMEKDGSLNGVTADYFVILIIHHIHIIQDLNIKNQRMIYIYPFSFCITKKNIFMVLASVFSSQLGPIGQKPTRLATLMLASRTVDNILCLCLLTRYQMMFKPFVEQYIRALRSAGVNH